MKNMLKLFGIIAFAAIIGVAFVACDNGTGNGYTYTQIDDRDRDSTSNDNNNQNQQQPTVTGVTVAPAAIAVLIGTEQDFTAAVQGTNNPPQTVTWIVEGNQHQDTAISNTGRLSVHINEDALTLVVRATSTHTASISGTATVTVTDIPPVDPTGYTIPTGLTATFGQTLSDITLPANWAWANPNASVGTAGSQTHSAIYTRIGNYNPIPRDITITVGQATPSYTIPTGLTATFGQTLSDVTLPSGWTWNNPGASVGAVGTQTHYATYTPADFVNFGTVTRQVSVNVTAVPPTVTSVSVNPNPVTLNRGGNQAFTATVAGANNPPDTVTWAVESGGAGTSINASGVLTVATGETAASLTVRATSTFNIAISGTAAVTVPQPTVTNVTISPSPVTVNRGGNQTFTATVTGTNNPPQTVTWTVTGGGIGTSINASGVLTVAATEIANLTVRATSTFDTAVSGTADATVPLPPPLTVDMVRINPGSVSPPVGNTITITAGYYIGRFQVTQALWQEVMTGNPNGISATPSWFSTGGGGAAQVSGMNTANFPVEQISWFDALVFSNRLSLRNGRTPAYRINGSTNPNDWGQVPTNSWAPPWNAQEIVAGSTGYRLPTGTQWEFAARAGTTTDFHNGVNWVSEEITAPLVAPIAWIRYNSGGRTHQVGTRVANAWGLHDMHGNVHEWCFNAPFIGPGRQVRGGSRANYAESARVWLSWGFDPWVRSHFKGIRLVRP